jgi:hypothetical protein
VAGSSVSWVRARPRCDAGDGGQPRLLHHRRPDAKPGWDQLRDQPTRYSPLAEARRVPTAQRASVSVVGAARCEPRAWRYARIVACVSRGTSEARVPGDPGGSKRATSAWPDRQSHGSKRDRVAMQEIVVSPGYVHHRRPMRSRGRGNFVINRPGTRRWPRPGGSRLRSERACPWSAQPGASRGCERYARTRRVFHVERKRDAYQVPQAAGKRAPAHSRIVDLMGPSATALPCGRSLSAPGYVHHRRPDAKPGWGQLLDQPIRYSPLAEPGGSRQRRDRACPWSARPVRAEGVSGTRGSRHVVHVERQEGRAPGRPRQ